MTKKMNVMIKKKRDGKSKNGGDGDSESERELEFEKEKERKEEEKEGGTSKKKKMESDSTDNADYQEGSRLKKQCPYPGCKASVVHIPRHLVSVHKWERERARKAATRYGLRKKYTYKEKKHQTKPKAGSKKHKDYHIRRLCPIPGCMSIVLRLPQHLKNVHKVNSKSKEYAGMLSTAIRNPKCVLMKKTRNTEEQEDNMESDANEECPNELAEADDELVLNEEEKEDNDIEIVEEEGEETEKSDEDDDIDEHIVSDADKDLNHDTPVAVRAVLSKFSYWLHSADGGRKEENTANQHSRQVEKILFIIEKDPVKQNLTLLLDKEAVRDKFLTQYAELEFHPGTIKSYLTSLRHFYDFLISEEPKEVSFDKKLLPSLREKVTRWNSSYKKATGKRMWQKAIQDFDDLITPDKVRAFESSAAARQAVSYLGQLSGAHNIEITQHMYTLIRDFLMAEITVNNAHRSGVIANMQVAEFERGQTEEDQIVVNVFEHKTVHIHGPAQVVFNPTLHSWINIYLRNVRSCVLNAANASHLFLSWNGEKMASSQITMCAKSIWKKAGFEGVVSSTALRKAAATVTCDKKQSMSADLADLMAHRVQTQTKYYRLRNKKKVAARTSQELSKLMRNVSDEKKTQEIAVVTASMDTDNSNGKKVETNDEENGSFRFSNEELKEIRMIFETEITAKSISMDDVRQKIKRSEILKGFKPRRVYDRIRSEWRTSKPKQDDSSCVQPPCYVPQETETTATKMERMGTEKDETASDTSFSVVYPTTVGSQGHGIFSMGEIESLQKACRNIIKMGPISKVRISKNMEKTEAGKTMLEKFTSEQLLNRVKYERRMKRRQTKL